MAKFDASIEGRVWTKAAVLGPRRGADSMDLMVQIFSQAAVYQDALVRRQSAFGVNTLYTKIQRFGEDASMTKSQTEQPDEDIALARLVDLYPLAFALASTSTFRSGVALREQERLWLVRPLDAVNSAVPPCGEPLPLTAVGLHPIPQA